VSSQIKTNVVAEQIRIRVRTSCYYSPNKILVTRTTYCCSENNKNINEGKNIKRKEYKNGNRNKKYKVESKK
jgi:hypothetical protein